MRHRFHQGIKKSSLLYSGGAHSTTWQIQATTSKHFRIAAHLLHERFAKAVAAHLLRMYEERADRFEAPETEIKTRLIEESPPSESRRLTVRRALIISHSPNDRLLDQKAPSGAGNPHAGVIIDIAVLRYSPEQSRSFIPV